jgi:hypothetical protein
MSSRLVLKTAHPAIDSSQSFSSVDYPIGGGKKPPTSFHGRLKWAKIAS